MLESALRPIYTGQDNLRALDIGCGTGLAAYPAREYTRNGQLIGVDISRELLNIADSKHIYSKLEQADATYYAAREPEPFDFLVSSCCLPFLKNLNETFAVFNRCLKENGMFFFSIRHNTLSQDDVILYPPYSYIFSAKYIKNALSKTGFEIVSIQAMQDGLDEVIHDKKYFYVVKKIKNT